MEIRKIVTCVEETRIEMGKTGKPTDKEGRGRRGNH